MLVKFINFLHFYNIVYRLFSLKISKTTYIIVKIFRICLHKSSAMASYTWPIPEL